jgi:integrase
MGDQMSGNLNARKVETAPPGIYADGNGLYLCVSASKRRTWVFRFSWRGRRPEMGLGSLAADVGLAEARRAALEARKDLADGRNPIDARREKRRVAASKPTFGQVADALLEAKAAEWRNKKHREQWRIALTETTVTLRARLVDEIDTEAVLGAHKPLWSDKAETASRLRGRIEAVLDYAKAQGHRGGENPARWRGHLAHLLPKRGKLARGHHAAMAYQDVPAFMSHLRQVAAVPARALEFAVLTAARSGEVYGATWGEIDLENRVWIIPAARMKAAREHRVPLCDRAIEIVRQLATVKVGEFVFPGRAARKPLSHVAMAKVLVRMGVKGATVHGFRSAFRDWAGNETRFAREVAEAALAHVIGDKAEQAYRRSDGLEKRRALMGAPGSDTFWRSLPVTRACCTSPGEGRDLGKRGAPSSRGKMDRP